MANENSLYNFSWLDNDKEIYVLQNRKFRKDGNVYIGATAAYNLNQAFLNSYGGTARIGYFLSEDWGIEGVYGKNSSSENDNTKGIRERGIKPFYRQIDSFMGAMLVWSPFYSKINTFNKIVYFDWIFGVGPASVSTKDNRNGIDPSVPIADRNTLTSENSVGAVWDTGFRFYINENWSLRLDVTGITYKADKQKSDNTTGSKASIWFTSYDLGLGLNYAF